MQTYAYIHTSHFQSIRLLKGKREPWETPPALCLPSATFSNEGTLTPPPP